MSSVRFGRIQTKISGRFGEGEERSNAEIATPARCVPELQPVSLKVDDDPSTIIFPSCTRIKRCGGCCASSLLSCQPTAIEIRNFEVIDLRRVKKYEGKSTYYYKQPTRVKAITVKHFFYSFASVVLR